MISVLHVITTLDIGGAELALERLVRYSPADVEHTLLSLRPRGVVGQRLAADGFAVTEIDAASLGARRTIADVRRQIAAMRPSVVNTWLYHGNVLGGIAARAAGVRPVVWSLRSSDLHGGAWKRSTVALARAGGPLSRVVPDAIICGSAAALRFHARIGYSRRRMVVVPNGVPVPDVDPGARDDVRRELGLPSHVRLVGRNGRFHPHKDHATFFAAIGPLLARDPDLHAVLFGEDVIPGTPALAAMAEATGRPGQVHLLGRRDDVARLHVALDIACSSSLGEGFPNVVAEAMAAGTPVVGTDVGDTALIVGETGWVVPARDAAALRGALASALAEPPADLERRGAHARARIVDQYGIGRMVAAHVDLYRSLLATSRR